ncbi:MAG TPA: GYF domain-containing protein [Holophaga sp.]|nr:GYF domain-containing protein [Holophaga sp.]
MRDLYVHHAGTTSGPFPEPELRRRLGEGEFPAEALVNVAGHTEWIPMGRALGLEASPAGKAAPFPLDEPSPRNWVAAFFGAWGWFIKHPLRAAGAIGQEEGMARPALALAAHAALLPLAMVLGTFLLIASLKVHAGFLIAGLDLTIGFLEGFARMAGNPEFAQFIGQFGNLAGQAESRITHAAFVAAGLTWMLPVAAALVLGAGGSLLMWVLDGCKARPRLVPSLRAALYYVAFAHLSLCLLPLVTGLLGTPLVLLVLPFAAIQAGLVIARAAGHQAWQGLVASLALHWGLVWAILAFGALAKDLV